MKLIMVMAITADGIIARDSNHFPSWTCSADKQMFKKISQAAGVVIMGSRTFRTIGKPLPDRLNVVLTRHPERFDPAPDLLIHTEAVAKLVENLAQQGYKEGILAGGAIINSLFIRERLVDELLLTISPKLFGKGLNLLSEMVDIDLKLLEVQPLDGDSLVLRYRLLYPPDGHV